MKLPQAFVALAVALFCLVEVTPCAHAEEVFRIEIGRDYENYTNSDLKRRVYMLERAVAQLQSRVFQLETSSPVVVIGGGNSAKKWTCRISSFGRTFSATESTRAEAETKAIEKCSSATNAMHCSDDNLKCGNE